MRYYVLLTLILFINSSLSLLGQDEVDFLPEITSSLGSIQKVELSPDGHHIAAMTVNPMGDTALEVWNINDTSNAIRVVPDLTMFDDFVWSPNGQYLATRGFRGNGSGTEYAVIVYDIFEPNQVGSDQALFAYTSRIIKEFVYDDDEPKPDYLPQWSADSRVLAINLLDGIYFIDITDCPEHKCTLLYILDVGYVDWFDWQGDTVITLDSGIVILWDVSDIID